jgi:5'-methylthioadenosine phosphorylase
VAESIPQASVALISGSAGWGLKFPEDLKESGIRVVERGMSFDTPWGRTDNWQLLECEGRITPEGRPRLVLNVFSHGWATDRVDHGAHQRAFWVLGKAGVEKVLSDSTCGSLNRALPPRDFVISSDILDVSQTLYSTLPGRFQYLCRGAQMLCPSMGETLERVARELWPPSGRVHGLRQRLVMAHTWGPRFESPAEARALQLLGADAVNQSIAPEATNAREIGTCFISASYVTDYVDGIIPDEWGELDTIHDELGSVAARISLRAVARVPLTRECGCHTFRMVRPNKYLVIGQKAKG